MRRLRLAVSAAGIAVAALAGHAVADDRGGPFRLSEAQLDGLTAGLLVIEVTAVAEAGGANPVTFTEVATTVVQRGRLEIGRGMGTAIAIGEDPVALVTTGFTADGKVVMAFRTEDRVDGPRLAAEQEVLLVVSFGERGQRNAVRHGKTGTPSLKGILRHQDMKFLR